MRYSPTFFTGPALALGFCLGLTGCARAPSEAPAAAPIPVTVSYPVEREVTDYADFTGRTAAVDSVEVRAHVWGYLDKVNFKEGALVKKGDVLFELDPRPYQAVLNQAKAKVVQDEAQLTYDEAEYQRNLRLVSTGAVSRSELDKAAAARGVDIANVAADKALVASRQLDLEYTKVIAPVSGRVSRYVVTVGNLIQSGDQNGGTLLTTIVSVDPMYAYFDVDEHTVLRVRQLIREGKAKSARDGELPVWLRLANEDGYPHRGTINFVDNQVNPKTGTLRLRGVFPNKDEALSPGYFARVRVPIGFPHQALLVSDRAIDTDQGQKIVYVVDRDNKVVSRPVRLGALHDGLREITDGLKPGERVIVNGLQQVRPGITVEPKLVDMPNGSQKSEVRGQRSEVNRVRSIHRSKAMPQRLEGKVAVVTGASKGIGASIAKHLADEGAAVVVNYASSKQGADRGVAEITGKGGRAIAVQTDLSKHADIKRLFAEAKKAFGRLDVLVNNAGVYEFAPLEAVTPEHFHRLFDLNVLGLGRF